jgi:hypothetical protein
MKIFYSTLLLIAAVSISNAQSSVITATVQSESNRFLHYAFIEDITYGTVAFSDSVGTFNLQVQHDSKIKIELSGYRDTSLTVDNIVTQPQIVLKSSLNFPVETEHTNIHPIFTPNGLLLIPKRRASAVGSRYISDTFLHGFFITTSGQKIYSTTYLYNYDKMSGIILLTSDNTSVFEVSDEQIKTLTLISGTDERMDFEKVPAIDHSHFVQVLATGAKYKVYKLTKTKYEPADFSNTAMGQTAGRDYDEYTDNITYFALDVATNQMQKFANKKGSIKSTFAKDQEKVKEFMDKNSSIDDESYIVNLVNFLNN